MIHRHTIQTLVLNIFYVFAVESQAEEDACHGDMRHCAFSNQCIPTSWFCDGEIDCFHGNDERNCPGTFDMFFVAIIHADLYHL